MRCMDEKELRSNILVDLACLQLSMGLRDVSCVNFEEALHLNENDLFTLISYANCLSIFQRPRAYGYYNFIAAHAASDDVVAR